MENTLRSVLVKGGATLALAAVLAGPSFAQATDEDVIENGDETAMLDTVTVTGFRQANSAAIADKRQAVGITDGINQDTIGLLPDLTVSDIARRIPGVTSVSATGGAGVRSLAGSENIVIRGLSPDLNLSTFDGAPIAYSWVDEYLSNILSDSGDVFDMFAQPRGVIDLQARYDLNDSVTLLAEVQNLTEEGLEFERRFPIGDYAGTVADRGRVAWLGVNVEF